MSAFPDWKNHAVHQRRPWTGCIPTSYEMMLRAAGAENVDFASFQDDFDLDKNWRPGIPPKNDFGSVNAEVQKKYPQVEFKHQEFKRGVEKLAFIEKQIAEGKPIVVSIWRAINGEDSWHIMPVVDMDGDSLTLLEYVDSDGFAKTSRMKKSELVRIHDNHAGGNNVAYLERC